MISKLASLVSGDQVIEWLIIALIVGYFVYKEWPDFKSRMMSGEKRESSLAAHKKQVNDRLDAIEKQLDQINEKMQRDYNRLNRFEVEINRKRKSDQESLEEQAIVMRSLLAIIEGLQEIGADGPTKTAQAEIMEYLNRKSHQTEE